MLRIYVVKSQQKAQIKDTTKRDNFSYFLSHPLNYVSRDYSTFSSSFFIFTKFEFLSDARNVFSACDRGRHFYIRALNLLFYGESFFDELKFIQNFLFKKIHTLIVFMNSILRNCSDHKLSSTIMQTVIAISWSWLRGLRRESFSTL